MSLPYTGNKYMKHRCVAGVVELAMWKRRRWKVEKEPGRWFSRQRPQILDSL